MEQQSREPLDQQSGETRIPQQQQEEVTEKTWLGKLKDKFLPGVRITLLISLIFYIAMFVVGIWGVHKCVVNDSIPLFLIVTGGIGLISKSSSILRETILKRHGIAIKYVETSFYTVELVFLILGSYWVFKVYKPDYNSGPRYCNKTVYLFAFIYLVSLYAIVILIGLGFCCFLGCLYFVEKTERVNDPESPTSPISQPQPESV